MAPLAKRFPSPVLYNGLRCLLIMY